MCSKAEENPPPKFPVFVQTWMSCYYATPKVLVFGQDVGFMMACFALLYVVRELCFRVLISFGWPQSSESTLDAAASMAGIFHTLNLVPILGYLLMTIPYNPSAPMKSYPRWWQNGVDAMMQLCCGHMLHDMIFGILATRYHNGTIELGEMDPIYIAHHLVTFSYMMSNLYAGVGQTAGITCMFWGEFTNPTFNANIIMGLSKGLECCQGPLAQQIGRVIELANAALFVPLRGFFMPFFAVWITFSFFGTKSGWQVNIVLRIVWTVLMWGIVHGSLPFVPEHWNLLVTHFTSDTAATYQEL